MKAGMIGRTMMMMRGCVFAVSGIALLTAASRAQSTPPEPVATVRSASKERVTFIFAPVEEALPVARAGFGVPTALTAIAEYGHAFGITNAPKQLAETRTWTDGFGHRHTSLAQFHAGVSVFSGALNVHQDQRGNFLGANGDFHIIDEKLVIEPTIGVEQAIAAARANLDFQEPVVSTSNLVIVDPGWYGDPPIGAHLAYHVTVRDGQSPGASAFFVDAHSGKILDQWSLLHTARFRRIFDGMQEGELPGELVRSEGDLPATMLADANRAYDYAGDVYGFLSRALDRDSVDDAGLPLTITVNSRYSGCPNAVWQERMLQSAFCDGTTSDDIVAHELGHALTLFTAGLVFQNQPGQLNESFSDVFGELIDLYNGNVSRIGPPGGTRWPLHLTGGGSDVPNNRRSSCTAAPDYSDGVRWLVGEDATAFGGALRDMWDPTCFGDPDRTGSEFYTCPPTDNGGVHIGSGVVNHAFAMLVDGKAFNGFTIEAIGPEKATAVWFRALEVYLTAASNFEDAYVAFGRSAQDMIGSMPNDPRTGEPTGQTFTAFDAEQVEKALLATEMNRGDLCGVQEPLLDPSPAPQCASRTILFRDDLETGANGWTFENSRPPTPYDWTVTSDPLPAERDGAALFCADRHVGDCITEDESAVHYAISPAIAVPMGDDTPMLSFTHFVSTEGGRDGGNVAISVNNDPWQTVGASDFLFNPYNARIRSDVLTGPNPLAGQFAWSGGGGDWGTTLIDLGGFVTGGDTFRVRFNFGKDLCVGGDGWYVDDVEVFTCPDCNLNGIPDGAEFHFAAVASSETTVGQDKPTSLMISSIPRASSDVTITTYASADLNDVRETLTFVFNGVTVGSLYGAFGDALDCPAIADRATFTIPQNEFNSLLDGDALAIKVVASRDVSSTLCADGTLLIVLINFVPIATDENDNQIPDECENCTVPDTLSREPNSVNKNRYVSLVPPRTDRLTALRAEVRAAPPGFEASIGRYYWVAEPFWSESSGGDIHGYARLSCDPVFTDWSGFDVVHVGDAQVAPGVRFDVQAIDLACFGKPTPPTGTETDPYSAPLSLRTVDDWGDVIGPDPNLPPGNGATVGDIAAMIDTLRLSGTIIGRTRADLIPAVPDLRITVFEIVAVVDAVRGSQYPYEFLVGCK